MERSQEDIELEINFLEQCLSQLPIGHEFHITEHSLYARSFARLRNEIIGSQVDNIRKLLKQLDGLSTRFKDIDNASGEEWRKEWKDERDDEARLQRGEAIHIEQPSIKNLPPKILTKGRMA